MPIKLQLTGDLNELPEKAALLLAKFAKSMADQDPRLAGIVPCLDELAKSLGGAIGAQGQNTLPYPKKPGADTGNTGSNARLLLRVGNKPTKSEGEELAASTIDALAHGAAYPLDPNGPYTAEASKDVVGGLYGVVVSGGYPSAAIDYNIEYPGYSPGAVIEAESKGPGVLTSAIEAALPEPNDSAQLVTTTLESLPSFDGREYKKQMERMWADRRRLAYDAAQGTEENVNG